MTIHTEMITVNKRDYDALVKALEACVTDLSAYYDGRNDEDADTDEALSLASDALTHAKR